MPRRDASPDTSPQTPKKQLPLSSIFIPQEILEDHRLSPVDKIIYGFVLSTDLNESGSYWSNDSLGQLLNLTQPTISTSFTKLAEVGYITLEYKKMLANTIRIVRNNFKMSLTPSRYKTFIPYGIKNLLANNTVSKDTVYTKDNKDLNTCGAPSAQPRLEKTSSHKNISRSRVESRKPAPNPAIDRVVSSFKTVVFDELGFTPPVTAGRDHRAAKDALKTMDEQEIAAVFKFFCRAEQCEWQRKNQGVLLGVALSTKTVSLFRQHGAAPKKGPDLSVYKNLGRKI